MPEGDGDLSDTITDAKEAAIRRDERERIARLISDGLDTPCVAHIDCECEDGSPCYERWLKYLEPPQ